MAFRVSHLVVVLVLVAGQIVSQSLNDLDTTDIEKQVKNIPGLENFNASKIPTEEELERILKEKCLKNGAGEEAFNALKSQQSEIQECLEAQLNATEIQAEVEEAKKTGSMDEVFGKYCKKYPDVYKCVEVITEKARPCLDNDEQETLNKTLKIVDELKEFLCYKDGDRIAMFIAEGGVECLDERKDGLQECANRTIGARIPKDFSVSSLPSFLITDRECNDFDQLRQCFNDELEKCKDSTPANIVDAFFKFLKKYLPCGTKSALSEPKPNSSSTVTVSAFVMVVAVLVSKYF